MTKAEALQRSLSALDKVMRDTNHFDHGGMDSGSIKHVVACAMRAEFGGAAERREYIAQTSNVET